ncbi:MAG: beta-ureidopropionase [Candidatus Cloacimonetes bacterium]|nr:beta-ureidopropionase [Candidatus Cloacimonadota bacterium]
MAKEKNLETMVNLVSKTKADLIVFPELATSGYTFINLSEVEQVAETFQKGLTYIVMKKAAWDNNCSIVLGFVEEDAGNFYNSAMLINPDGSSYLYRKTHLFLHEKSFFSPGDTGFQVFPAKNNIKIGIMICFDWIFPEAARSLMLNGAQIIAHPANLVLPWCQQAMLTRSIENRVFTITANRTGVEKNNSLSNAFTGQSQITSPLGERLLQADDSSQITGIFDIFPEIADNKSVTAMNDLITDRRQKYYHS